MKRLFFFILSVLISAGIYMLFVDGYHGTEKLKITDHLVFVLLSSIGGVFVFSALVMIFDNDDEHGIDV